MKYVIALLILLLSCLLFYKAAGSLKIKSLNIVSYIFYSLLVFDFIGITLIYLGFNDHYLMSKLYNTDVAITKAYFSMAWTMIALPTFIIIFNKYVFKIDNTNKQLIEKNSKNILPEKRECSDRVFYSCIIIFVICLLSTGYVFYKIGYIPLFKLFDRGFNFAVERIKSGRNFVGNQYIKNIIMILITPFISYVSFTYMRVTKSKKWKLLFILTFILTIFVKTYDFSKGPIVYYIAYFFFIEVMLGKVKNIKKVFQYGAAVILLVICLYLTIGNYKGNFISLSNGPISRTVITQPGALLLHFDAFPRKVPYLRGHSFPRYFKIIFGNGEYGVRSGRAVMQVYNPDSIQKGTAGVMSTVFVGEAYANFGYYGIIIAPIIVGFIISCSYCFYLKSKKTILNICLYLEIIILIATVVQAGFVDFIYNPSFIIILVITIILKLIQSNKKMSSLLRQNRFFENKGRLLSEGKHMIFYIPNCIDNNRKSGSQIRPIKMINAFKENGYDVDVVMGYAKDRKKSIKDIKHKIKKGIKYDFLYSESSTMPTLLTEKSHFPIHPFFDFSFLKYCKNNGIKVGLFYRDVYWKFDVYKKNVSYIKRKVAELFYKYDLKKYNSVLNVLYVVTNGASEYVKDDVNCEIKLLPPGCDIRSNKKKSNSKKLNIFYVGGISSDLYNLEMLFKTVCKMTNINLTVCCRKEEWDNINSEYESYLANNIHIIHKSGKELNRYFDEADVCSLIFKPSDYMKIALPVKTMEYISNKKPIIAIEDTEASKFIKKYDIGFAVRYNEEDLKKLLLYLLNNKKILKDKIENIEKIIYDNTWKARAKQVELDLKS